MVTRSSNEELASPLPEPERTINQRRRRNKRVPISQKDLRPETPKEIVPSVDNLSLYRFFINFIHLHDPMDETDNEPMWANERTVAPTPGPAITLPETANEFAIKGNHLTLVKGNQFDGRKKTDLHTHTFMSSLEFVKCLDTEKPKMKPSGS